MSLKKHEIDYKQNAWENYSFQELGNWVHLLAMRALQRSTVEKKEKDLYDAQNYLNMMQTKLNGIK